MPSNQSGFTACGKSHRWRRKSRFCGSTGLQAGEIAAKKKRALAPAQFANSRINIGDPWKRAPGLKPGINPTSIAGLKSGAPTKPKSLLQNTFSASCKAGAISSAYGTAEAVPFRRHP
jgi:hypothetical protein